MLKDDLIARDVTVALTDTFADAGVPRAKLKEPDISANRIDVLNAFLQGEKETEGCDEFDFAASMIAGRIVRDGADGHSFVDGMNGEEADVYFGIVDSIDLKSPRELIEAVLVDHGLLPRDYKTVQASAPGLEKAPRPFAYMVS